MGRDLWKRSSAPQRLAALGASPRMEVPEALWPTCASARPSSQEKARLQSNSTQYFSFSWALGPSLGTTEEHLPLAPLPPPGINRRVRNSQPAFFPAKQSQLSHRLLIRQLLQSLDHLSERAL